MRMHFVVLSLVDRYSQQRTLLQLPGQLGQRLRIPMCRSRARTVSYSYQCCIGNGGKLFLLLTTQNAKISLRSWWFSIPDDFLYEGRLFFCCRQFFSAEFFAIFIRQLFAAGYFDDGAGE